MKKILTIVLALCLILGLTACSGGNSEEAAYLKMNSNHGLKDWSNTGGALCRASIIIRSEE